MKKSLVIILYDHPKDHTADYADQVSEYFRRDHVILSIYCNDAKSIKELLIEKKWPSFIKIISSCYIQLTPIYSIPFKRFNLIRKINIQLLSLYIKLVASVLRIYHNIGTTYVWLFSPLQYYYLTGLSTDYIVIYDCVDFHELSEYTNDHNALLQRADHVFANSQVLYKHLTSNRPNVIKVPVGFDKNRFSDSIRNRAHISPSNKPKIGYIGGINSRLHFDLLLPLIRKHTEWDFVFIGPVQQHEVESQFISQTLRHIAVLRTYPNVQFIPDIPKNTMGSYLKTFTLCMIPYDISLPFNALCYPMKLMEYFYAGKPVISTPIVELKQFKNYVSIGSTVNEWEMHISSFLKRAWPKNRIKDQRKIAQNNSWDAKFSTIIRSL